MNSLFQTSPAISCSLGSHLIFLEARDFVFENLKLYVAAAGYIILVFINALNHG